MRVTTGRCGRVEERGGLHWPSQALLKKKVGLLREHVAVSFGYMAVQRHTPPNNAPDCVKTLFLEYMSLASH